MQLHIDKEVESFISLLDKNLIAKALRTIDLLEKFGHRLSAPHSKSVGKNLFELRVRGKQEVRIFYCFYKKSAYLLHGYVKKTQRAPAKELAKARNKLKALTSI